MKARRLFLFALALLAAGLCRAEEVGEIHVHRRNVFDPIGDKPLGFPYSTANALHIVTREGHIRRDLLLGEGDVYDSQLVAESERLLRSRPFFREVAISTSVAADGRVDLNVYTADVWTTSVRPTYGSVGGQQYYGMGVLEQNFLGRGKTVGAFVLKDIDRVIRGVNYADPQFFGTHWRFDAGYGRDEKGEEWEVGVDRPFFAAHVPHAEGVRLRLLDDEDRLFEDGDEAALFQHHTEDVRAYVAYALRPSRERVRRLSLAYERQLDEFSDLRIRPGYRAVPVADREISAALIGFDYRNLDFRRYSGVMTFDRVEDINHGWEWFAEAGPSLKSMGATRDGAFGRFQIQKILGWGERMLWFNHLDMNGRVESKTLRNGVMRLRSEAFLLDWRPKNTAILRGEWISSHNLDAENQFLLGGENGLRAYPARQFAGSNSLIVSLENRRVVVHDWLRLVSVGWAVFADAGAAWERHRALRMSEVKSDLGAGIRFAPSRSVDPGIIRVDLAYALQDNDSSSRLALNIGADIHFGDRRARKFDQ